MIRKKRDFVFWQENAWNMENIILKLVTEVWKNIHFFSKNEEHYLSMTMQLLIG